MTNNFSKVTEEALAAQMAEAARKNGQRSVSLSAVKIDPKSNVKIDRARVAKLANQLLARQ